MRPDRLARILALLVVLHASPATADSLVVQCTVDQYRSSFAPRPDLFTIQVDTEARVITTNFGTMPLKLKRRELRGSGGVDGGWRSRVSIDRNTGRLEAGVDKVERGKYAYVDLKGICILPSELQGARYSPPAAIKP